MIKKFGNELNVLLEAKKEELQKIVDEKVSDAIIKNREGKITIQPGFDGEYGKPLFSDKCKVEIKTDKPKFEQKGLDEF